MILSDPASRKRHLRARLWAERRIVGHSPVVRPTGVVASYVCLPDEPDPTPLLVSASTILLPRVLPDRFLELVAWTPGDPLSRSWLGTLEPAGLAVDPALVDVVLVPALAVDPATGHRLGRGGGSYDRLLGAIPVERRWAVLAGEQELVEVPYEPHDVPVGQVVLPDRVLVIPR